MTTSSTKPAKERSERNTPEGIAHQLREDEVLRAVGILRAWMPKRREREATEEKVMAIRALMKEAAVEVVTELKKSRKYIRGTKGQDMKLRVTIESVHTGSEWETSALLDSGATGSCVNKEFVEKNGLLIKELPVKLPVYNADRTLNEGGAIKGFVEVRMKIGDHAKKIELAVTNLGRTSIFLGLDCLRYHNPTIN